MFALKFSRVVRQTMHAGCRRPAVALAAAVLGSMSFMSCAHAGDAPVKIPGTQFEVVVGESQIGGSGSLEPRLLDGIARWLSDEFDLPPPGELPTVLQVSGGEMIAVRYGAGGASGPPARNAYHSGHEILALYDDRIKAIYLSDTWSGRTPGEISILVHEVVHHLQNLAGLSHACPQEREKLAYGAQARFLALFGKSLESEFSIDPMTLLLRTSCMM